MDLTVLVLSSALWIPLSLVSMFDHPTSVLTQRSLDALTTYGPALPGFYLLQREYRPALAQFGLTWRRLKTGSVLGWMVAAVLPVGLLWLTLTMENLHLPRTAPTMNNSLQGHFWSAPSVLTATILLVLAPIVEELFFRGYLYLLVTQNWGRTAGVIVSSGAFAAVHGPHAPLMFLWSLLNVYFNNRAASLCPSVAAHIIWNVGFLLYLR